MTPTATPPRAPAAPPRRARLALLPAALAAVAVAGCLGPGERGPDEKAGAAPVPVLRMNEDRYPNASAEDWVTYADHVLQVAVVRERAGPPEELSGGEGFIDRTVTLRTERVVWNRPEAPQRPPESLTLEVQGWAYSDDDPDRRRVSASEDEPRLEVGHRYLLAVVREPARCSPGDGREPAHWVHLGEGAQFPYDKGRIGVGENEGRLWTLDQAREKAAGEGPNHALEEELVGLDADALAARLAATRPGEREPFGPDPKTTRCG